VRETLIIGGVFLMLLGVVILYTTVESMIAQLFLFVGLIIIMLGFVTPRKRIIVTPLPQVIIHGTTEKEIISSEERTKILAICPECKNRIPSNSKFCPECGANLQPPNK
jgi:hypothetical protein